jgi:hypothetical protein
VGAGAGGGCGNASRMPELICSPTAVKWEPMRRSNSSQENPPWLGGSGVLGGAGGVGCAGSGVPGSVAGCAGSVTLCHIPCHVALIAVTLRM